MTTHDAHAWPEAWFSGTGWVRFEPTPSESGATIPDYTQPGGTPLPSQSPGTATPTPTPSSTARPALPEEDLLDLPDGSEREPGRGGIALAGVGAGRRSWSCSRP